MKPNLLFLFVAILLQQIITQKIEAQTCESYSFNPPSVPSCTYTYTSSGWFDSVGNPISPPSTVNSSDTVCILADNNDTLASSGFKGNLYVASGVTYSGNISSINGATVYAEGTLSFPINPSFQNATVYVYDTGEVSVPGTFNPSGSSTIFNNGVFNIGDELQMGGNATFINFNGSKVKVQNNASVASEFANCGILEVVGSLSSGGSSALVNNCSLYVQGDMSLNSDYTNNGLFVLDGNLSFGTATFYNYGTMLVNDINLSNDNIIGDDINSVLIVRTNSALASGGGITGHMFYDVDDGGGFDSSCGSCTEDIDVLLDVTIPSSTDLILENCGANIEINPFLVESRLDFDGIDDYLSTPEFINGQNQVSIMAWVKSDSGNTSNMTIGGEDTGCKLWLQSGNVPSFTISTVGNSPATISTSAINFDEWHHISGTYTSATGKLNLYIDGELVNSGSVGGSGAVIQSSGTANGNFEVGRTSAVIANRQYFKGDIDEVRVFDKALTDSQIQQMVYQEIEEGSGNVQGKSVPKAIEDDMDSQKISWSSLLAYYPMTDIISYERTTDFSQSDRLTKLHNITSMQQQTAPMPYETVNDGDWSAEGTWAHGNVWDIEDISSNKDWSIVKIKDNVTTSSSHTNLGLIIDSGAELVVNGDYKIENTYYLELNGTLDLMGDSQLIQGSRSDLVTSSDGKIKRRQEGTSSHYCYNYWGSPVGSLGATPLADNNATGNNPNNGTYNLGMLRKPDGTSFEFTGALQEMGKISVFWLYTYINGVTYNDWGSMDANTPLPTGVGYTQKGTGIAGTEQQYLFEGKPNNGTIVIDVTDTGGSGSVPAVSKTDYLMGNPYPSALDLHQFIDDNVGVIDGTIQLWQQWSGSSHILNEYNGGYAQVNKTGSVRAYQFVGLEGANNGSQDGTKKPSRYLPVGQGFMVEVIADGQVRFNNGQRLFIKESDHDGTYNNGSIFFKNGVTGGKSQNEEELMQTIRLEFTSVDGPDTRRELLLGFSNFTTEDFDYGYEAKNTDEGNDDLNLVFNDELMTIQAYSAISEDKSVPLKLTASGNYNYAIRLTEMENIGEDQELYLRDNLTGTYYDLRNSEQPYEFTSESGEFADRFEVVFSQQSETLSQTEHKIEELKLYYAMGRKKIVVLNPNSAEVSNISVIDILGKTVYSNNNPYPGSYGEYDMHGLVAGTYIVQLITADGFSVAKKIIVK
ncbi:LamG-like jellyroll fold domain-containing protein [Winogradskyella alexanderae]|uniref:T9SS type A sorting domain-containing protein n=1 Tax=Winogradskyella alexanderae TaxID=2877123 RepID=A0ABS7XN78_9FLAO|nr:LamG-like jellyroll fold domain-containing protein [Winogradskyella alexanderae]MCA0131462.1 T9SS type A sorting domain-containing protein [Winogradskyella alexanderae]